MILNFSTEIGRPIESILFFVWRSKKEEYMEPMKLLQWITFKKISPDLCLSALKSVDVGSDNPFGLGYIIGDAADAEKLLGINFNKKSSHAKKPKGDYSTHMTHTADINDWLLTNRDLE